MDTKPLNPSVVEEDSTSGVEEEALGTADVKVIGLGGGGSNAVNRMIELGITGVDFIAANTDRQALASSLAPTRLQLGPRITRGLGAGGDPKVGASAAMESSRDVADALRGADMVFVTAGMGGGTGTGSAPVAAEIAQELGAVTISIVTMPFGFEMSQRSRNALEGVKQLQPHSHTLITVPNDKLLEIVPRDVSLEIAFRFADDVLRQGIQGIAELVTRPGLINVDFAHIRALMTHGGGALMAIGLGEGGDRATKAIHQALHHPLLDSQSIDQANGALVHFTGGEEMTLYEIGEAMSMLRENLPDEAEVVLGATTDPSMSGRAQVILIVTGIGGQPVPAFRRAREASPVKANTETQDSQTEQEPVYVDVNDLDVPAFLRRRSSMGS